MRYILTISCLLTSLWAFAQPVALPLTSNPTLQEYAKAHPQEAKPQFKSAPAALTLPFMDDFSYNGPYPTSSLWMDNDVFVNNTLGVNPPSVGVATLDGLNAEGLPYSDTEGWADTLTSQVINLSQYMESDDVILSFFAQQQGLGDAPEEQDSLIIEFRNTNLDWEEVGSVVLIDTLDFQYKAYTIDSLYLDAGFQFRFRNFNARTGFVDLWHIDYVKIDEGRTENSEVFEDVCFTGVPRSYLKEFTAMPWAHYWDNNLGEVNLTLLTDVRNHNGTESITNIDFTSEEITTGVKILIRDTGNETIPPESNLEFDLYPSNIQTVNDLNIGDLSPNLSQANIITQYILNAPGQQNFNLTNDTVTTETIFANYFAYDDGSAEYNIGFDGEGAQAAVRFVPNLDDSLKAVQIHIPYATGDLSGEQRMTLKIWETDPTGEPADEAIYSELVLPNYSESIGGFHEYPIVPAIPLTGGQSYFIGWEQTEIGDYGIPIGVDKNNLEVSANNYYNIGLGWFPFPSYLPGALMIRAVVTGDPFYTANEPALNASEIAEIFPNPVKDNLFINLKSNHYEDYQIGLFNSAGQIIHISQLQPSIPLNTLPSGIYFIQIKENNTNAVYYEKFVKK